MKGRGKQDSTLAQLNGRLRAVEGISRALGLQVKELQGEVHGLEDTVRSRDERIAELEAENDTMRRTLSYYQNSNTPPSSASLEHKRRKREVRRARERGELPPHGTPGGRPGHRGTSRRHAPTETERHRVGRGPCECGGRMEVTVAVRDIIEIPPPRPVETRHYVESATCADCGATRRADSGLPARGSYGRRLVGAVASSVRARTPVEQIATEMLEVHGVPMSKATVLRIRDNVADALEPEAERIWAEIRRAPHVHVDETGFPSSGEGHWTWAAKHECHVGVEFSKSRGAQVLDVILPGYEGVAITDGHPAYNRFDAGGMHQRCWAHELRAVEHAARMHGGGLPGLHADLLSLYRAARDTAVAPCAELRRAMEDALASLLDRHDDGGGVELARAVARLRRAAPQMFAFCEHAGVAPTNNAAERELRDVVVRRKVSGQLKGGAPAARRMSILLTCFLTWRAMGKSVVEEVMRAV